MSLHPIRYPNESEEYRRERDALLDEELTLRAHVEAVAAKRRTLPRGGAVPEDYAFHEMAGGIERAVHLSELFEPGVPSLVVYNYMFSPDMPRPCPMCTPFLDGLDGQAVHISQRTNLAVVAKSPPGRLQGWAESRGWRHLRLLSWEGTSYGRDYHAEALDGSQRSVMNVFTKDVDGVHHSWSSEMAFVPVDGHPRHIDAMWPLWNVLDLTPEGRGTDWIPPLFPPDGE